MKAFGGDPLTFHFTEWLQEYEFNFTKKLKQSTTNKEAFDIILNEKLVPYGGYSLLIHSI